MATEARLRRLSERIAQLTDRRDSLASERRGIAARLHAEGWSLQQIAEAAGVTKATVQGWLR